MAVGLMGRMLQVWRFQRIGNRHRNDGGLLSAQGLAAEVDHDGGIEQHRDAEDDESALVVAGQVLEKTHEVWADESTEDAEGVNGGDGGGGGPAAEETLDDGQPGALHCAESDRDATKRGYGDARRVGEAGGGESQRHEDAPGNDVLMAFAGVSVRKLRAEKHCGQAEQADAGGYEANASNAELGRGQDQLGKDEDVAVGAGEQQEPEDADLPDAWVDEDAVDGIGRVVDMIAFVVDVADDPVAFGFGQPRRVGGFVGRSEEHTSE